jgi:hypothetical protein
VTVDLRRLRPAELLALASGVLLAVSLFLPWFERSGVREDAWTSTVGPAAVAALTVATAFALAVATATQRSPALPLACAVLATVTALVCTLLVAVNAASPPISGGSRCYGLWVGLVASVGVLAAGWRSLRDERPFRGVPVSR